jgi:hypothetical protein
MIVSTMCCVLCYIDFNLSVIFYTVGLTLILTIKILKTINKAQLVCAHLQVIKYETSP